MLRASILRMSSMRVPFSSSFSRATFQPSGPMQFHACHVVRSSSMLMSTTSSLSGSESKLEDLTGANPLEIGFEKMAELTEPSFYSQGLGFANWMPPGWLQGIMEQMHLSLDMPWWATIITTTVVLRVGVLPLIIKSRKAFVTQGNLQPELDKRQKRMLDTSLSQQKRIEAKEGYLQFMKDNGIHPKTTMLPILCNGAIFMAMFFAIRGMATLPVKSMEAGGLYWFTDLTIADPYFILPIITASSLLIHLKVGGDGLNLDALPPFIKKLMLVMPIISIPFMCAFPAALNLYWLTSNLVTITQARVLEIESVRIKLGIPKIIKHSEPVAPPNPISIIKQIIKEADAQKPPESFAEVQQRIEESMRLALKNKEGRK